MTHELKAQRAGITAQIEVRDKDGNLKYKGPLHMDVVKSEPKTENKEKENGGNPPNGS